MTDDPQVQRLLDELDDSGATPGEVCGSYPELLPVVRNRWRQMRRLRADLDVLFPTPPEQEDSTPAQPPNVAGLPHVPGHEVEAVLGRGGMGIVFRARHLRLNRPVAVKMLLAGAYAGERDQERFRREAEAVASLRHANVVHVYDVGEIDGRPYFTMELVDGGSLAEKLAGTPQPAGRSAQVVATLAEAVHAAHKCGIIHRDLKPANILLTSDGTPKITDFGLARRLGGESGLTRTGMALGTPSYMAPEQVEGKIVAVGPATDVYALGAILYELLTGRPPFKGESGEETHRQVVSQEPVPPSRLNAKVPRDVETICLKCLQKAPSRRYASAAALAEDLHRYERGEPITARPMGPLERLARWVRRRPAAAGLLATLAVVVAAIGIGALLLYQQRVASQIHQAKTDGEVRGVLKRARALLEEGSVANDITKLTEARAESDRAVDVARSGEASPLVQQEAKAFQSDAAAHLERAKKNRALLEELLEVSAPQENSATVDRGIGWVLAQPNVDEQFADAFRRWGLDVDATPWAKVVERLRQEPDVVRQELIAGLDAWTFVRGIQGRSKAARLHLYWVADQLDQYDGRRKLRELLFEGLALSPATVTGLVGTGSPWLTLGVLSRTSSLRISLEQRAEIDAGKAPVLTVLLLARVLANVGDAAKAEHLLHQATVARPNQILLLDALAKLNERQGGSRLSEAIGYYRAARAIRPDLRIALSKALLRAGRPREAEDVLREITHRTPASSLLLAEALFEQKKPEDAQSVLLEALEHQKDPEVYFNLGIILAAQRKDKEAVAAYREAAALQPNDPWAYIGVGEVFLRQGKYDKAEPAYRKAIDVKPDLAQAHHGLAKVLTRQRKLRDAEAALLKAALLQPGTAQAHLCLSTVHLLHNEPALAESESRKAIDLKPDFADAWNNLGNALTGQGKLREAETAFRKAMALDPEFPEGWYNFGNVLRAQGDYAAAEAAYRNSIRIKSDDPEVHNNLGLVLLMERNLDDAEIAFHKAIDLRPGFGVAQHGLGLTLMHQARFDEAAAAQRKAFDLLSDNPLLRNRARQFDQKCERFAALDAQLPAILKEADKLAGGTEQMEFAQLCLFKKLNAAAARFYCDAFAAASGLAEPATGIARYDAARAAALAGCGQGKDAGKLDDKERSRWRRQALDWLRQDLEWCIKTLDDGDARTSSQVRLRLRHWQIDVDLAGLREPGAIEALPSDEGKACRALWKEVAAVLDRVSGPK